MKILWWYIQQFVLPYFKLPAVYLVSWYGKAWISMVLPVILQTADSVCKPSQAIQQTTGATHIHVEPLNCVTKYAIPKEYSNQNTVILQTGDSVCMPSQAKPYNRPRWYTHPVGAAPELCHSSDKVYSPPPSFDHTHCMGAALWHTWDNFESSLQAEHTNCLSSPVQLSASPNTILSPSVFIQHAFLVQVWKGHLNPLVALMQMFENLILVHEMRAYSSAPCALLTSGHFIQYL